MKQQAIIVDIDGTLANCDHRIHYIKKEIYRHLIKPYYDVLFAIDDRQQVVDLWRDEGLVCLQCAKGDY